jgi:hypothetical protein
MRKLLIVLLVAIFAIVSLTAQAEDGDIEALRWDCMALSVVMVGRSFGIPASQSSADSAMLVASTKFAEQEHVTQGIARGRMCRAMAFFGGPVGVTNECIERGWYRDHAN